MQNMKRIAFVSNNEGMPWGGSEELWSQTAMRLAKEGVRVGANVMKWSKEHPRIRQLEASGCLVKRREYRRNIFQRALYKCVKDKAPYDWLDKFSPNLVVLSFGGNISGVGWMWMKACLDKNIPYVIIIQNGCEHIWPNDELFDGIRTGYINSKRCFFVSHRLLEFTETQIGVHLENNQIIRNPCKISFDFSPPMPPVDSVRMACIATLNPTSKGQDILFKVLSSEKWRGRPITLSLFGCGYFEKILRRLKAMLKLENVQFCGVTDDIESVWKTHHALILPSRHEGLPMTLVEAMFSGRVCIVTDVGGNAELINDNFNGFIAKAALPYFLDEAMERAWQRRGSWHEIGRAAAESVRKIIPRDPVGICVDELKQLL